MGPCITIASEPHIVIAADLHGLHGDQFPPVLSPPVEWGDHCFRCVLPWVPFWPIGLPVLFPSFVVDACPNELGQVFSLLHDALSFLGC